MVRRAVRQQGSPGTGGRRGKGIVRNFLRRNHDGAVRREELTASRSKTLRRRLEQSCSFPWSELVAAVVRKRQNGTSSRIWLELYRQRPEECLRQHRRDSRFAARNFRRLRRDRTPVH